LFLPTVEGLPSAWKLYTKQVALFAVVILGGLCIGFSAATAKRWWPMLTAPASVPVADSESSVSQVEASGGASALTPRKVVMKHQALQATKVNRYLLTFREVGKAQV